MHPDQEVDVKRALRTCVLLIGLLVVFLPAACGGGTQGTIGGGGEEGQPERLRFAVPDLQGLEELRRDWRPLQQEFSEIAGVDVELFPVSDNLAAVEALAAGQVDLVLTGPSEYVATRARTEAVPLIGLSRPGYRTEIRTYEGSGIESVEDLRGKRIDVVDAGSTSGHLGTAGLLADNGIDPQEDVEIVFLGDAGVRALMNEEIDAIGRSFEGGFQTAFDEADITDYDERFPVVVRGSELPPDVFMASPDLPEGYRNELRASMIENEDRLIEAILRGESENNNKYRESALIPVEDPDFDYIREAYRTIGVEDFSEALEE